MKAEAVVNRALSATNRGTQYGLGDGGMRPEDPMPSSHGKCDCSGFVAWALGMSRKTTEAFYVKYIGGWIETTAVAKDIASSAGIFEKLTTPVPGCVVVYGDHKDHTGKHREGHIAIVTEVNGQEGVDGIEKIVHCSMGNDRTGDAIQETAPTVFSNNANSVLGWYILVTP